MNDHSNALPVGYRLGEYEIQAVLGSGGFGITYRARDCKLSKSVAIKEYLPSDFAMRDGREAVKPKSASQDNYAWGLERFLDEARTLARFDHPHINKVHRFIETNGTAYLVLEYIEGDMLSDLLKRKGRFNGVGLRRMLDELLDGLDAVHSAGYIHRDIKPANIIFRRDGSAVLLDFGAARQAIGKRSQTITSILTPGYAPVEQYLNTIDAMGAWSDLYSLGVVAYRCLVGGDESVLIDAPSRAHLVQRGEVEKDMPAAVKVGADNYPMSLLRAIDWAMKVDERERPQSVAEMRAVLAGGDEVAQSVEPTPSVRVKKKGVKRIASLLKMLQSRRRVLGWTLGGIGALVLLVAVLFSVSQYQQRQAEKIAVAERVERHHILLERIRANLERQRAAEAERKRAAEVERQRVAEAERQRKAAAQAELKIVGGAPNAQNEPGVYRVERGDSACGIARRFAVNCRELILLNQLGRSAVIAPGQILLIPGVATLRALGSDLPDFYQEYKRYPAVRQVYSWGGTDLHVAAENGWAKLALWLIAYGADVNVQDNDDWTPLDFAIFNDHDALQSLLRRYGGQCNTQCQ